MLNCLNCKKKLTKVWWRKVWAAERWPTLTPLEEKQVYIGTRSEETQAWYGHRGKGGDGRFCSYRCGHDWAVAHSGGTRLDR